jgi:hypothetical protein
MFGGLNNQVVVVLLAFGIIVASLLVLRGTYFVLEAFVLDASEPLHQPIVWKRAPQRTNPMKPVLVSE